ncbi:ABC transporter permease [Glycomyces sp. L485]|uniref:FtsX-like permease family protein n=1 Tax=Glycomyces sp. L485 TaxID=2909235 RepID=UPI001F4A5C36|nr:FtsX-like permease family protein [Glycomyces sp. L485]MCH7232444.1 ABC transporter permease [Glycomyces sp. L485]
MPCERTKKKAAALIGLAAGSGIARALAAVLSSTGAPAAKLGVIDLPAAALTIAAGVTVTVASAAVPAFKSARTAAIAALRDTAAAASHRIGRFRLACGTAFILGGAAAWAMSFEAGLPLLALAGVAGFFGVVMVLPAVVPLFARALDRLPLGRSPVRLAVRHVGRNRRRAASAAAAIVLCTALVSAILIGAHSARTSVEREAVEEYPADYSVAGAEITPELVADLRDVDTLTVVHPRRTGTAEGLNVASTAPAIAERAGIDLAFGEGATVAVAEPAAEREGWATGDLIEINGVEATVTGVYPVGDDPAPLAAFDVLTDEATAAALLPRTPPTSVEILERAPSASAITAVTAAYPAMAVDDLVSYRESRTAGIDLVLRSMLALLFLSAVISVIGLSNMLSLSMYERVKEHGTLRALGTTRGGLRAMVTAESVFVSLLGAAIGIGLGLAGAYGAIRVIAADQPVSLEIPHAYMAVLVGATLAAAVAASLLPAASAARSSVIANLQAE